MMDEGERVVRPQDWVPGCESAQRQAWPEGLDVREEVEWTLVLQSGKVKVLPRADASILPHGRGCKEQDR